GMGGPIVPNKLFVFAALQGRWRGDALPSLTTADPGTLLRLGVSPDSAARFVSLAGATGAPVTMPGRGDDRAARNTLGLLRLDWQLSDVHTLTLRLDGSWDSQEPTRVGTLALPVTGGTRTAHGGGVMASLTSYVGGASSTSFPANARARRLMPGASSARPAGPVAVRRPYRAGGQASIAPRRSAAR